MKLTLEQMKSIDKLIIEVKTTTEIGDFVGTEEL